MLQASKDLWGELNFKNIEQTPVDLLNEQAYLLDEKTNNLLRGELLSRIMTPGGSNKRYYLHVFNIVAPKLRNRRKELLRFVHERDIYFPSTIFIGYGEEMKKFDVSNFKQFEKKLSEILSSSQTKDILQSMISDSLY